MHYEHTGRVGAKKYLRENYYYSIKCSIINFLAAFMWRRSLNSIALAIPTYRGPERVSDAISTQVVVWMINKWRVKIIRREIYNVSGPWQWGEWKIGGESTVATWTIFVTISNQYILEHTFSNWADGQFTLRNPIHFCLIIL